MVYATIRRGGRGSCGGRCGRERVARFTLRRYAARVKSTVGAATLLLLAGAFLGVGWIGLTDPAALLDPVGIELPSQQAAASARATAMNEARATYGGMHVALGLFFFGGVFLRRVRGIALTVALVYLSGLLVGRGVSLRLDGSPEPIAWVLGAVELVGLLLVFSALVRRWRLARNATRGAAPPSPPAPEPAAG